MIVCPIPNDELSRIQALHALQILDTVPDLRFDLIINHVAREFNVPIALITLIDSNRQWFKAAHGVDAKQIPSNISVCAHAICEINSSIPAKRVYEIRDLSADVRFFDNPQVVEEPNARAYISYILQSASGKNIGSLCLVDTKVRAYTDREKEILIGIGMLVDKLINGIHPNPPAAKIQH